MKSSWIVRMECIVIKDVVCNGCTKEEAKSDPWSYATDFEEIDQKDYEVLSVEPNE